MQAFSAFINDQSLKTKADRFCKQDHQPYWDERIYENVAELTKPPFDKPISFIKLLDAKTQTALMETINMIRENTMQIAAS